MNYEDIQQELVAATKGMMDGTLSRLGVVIGATGAPPEVIIAAGISSGLANSFSNIFAAFASYETELMININILKEAMLRKNMENTEVYQDGKHEVNKQSLADGIATTFGALVPVTPYFSFPLIYRYS